MSFFQKSSGETIEPTKSFVNTGIQDLIPAGTQLLCNVASATWEPETQYNNQHAKIMLHVVEKCQYKDFTVNHKLQVLDKESKKADKAIAMLMAYDSNAKGALLAADKAGKPIIGDNNLLARALNGAAVVATFDVYEMPRDDGSVMTGNWVRSIGPVPKAIQEEDKSVIDEEELLSDPDDDYYTEPDEDIIPF